MPPVTDGDPDPGPLTEAGNILYAMVPCDSDMLGRLVACGALHVLARSSATEVGEAIVQVLNRVLAKYGSGEN